MTSPSIQQLKMCIPRGKLREVMDKIREELFRKYPTLRELAEKKIEFEEIPDYDEFYES